MWEQLREFGYWAGEAWDRRKNGEIYPKWLSIGTVHDVAGVITHYFSIFSDITDRKRGDGRIQHLAYFDALTGLPNRTQFSRLTDQALKASKRNSSFGAVLFININRFKLINDTLGHAIGDEVLQEIARRFRCCLRGADLVCRLGSDEFAVGLFEIASRDHTANVVQKLLATLDDFGTGYSSLSYLKRFPIDTLKIDRSFIINIPADADDCAIAGAIVSMAKQLKHNVIAEGVETAAQLTFLSRLGCDQIQGYLFSPPVPAEQFAAMVRAGKRLAA